MAKKFSTKERDQVQTALEPHIKGPLKLQDETPVYSGPGKKPDVVKNFNDDERADEFATYLMQGLTEEEAGILAGFAPEEIESLQDKSDSYRRYVKLQMIKFKQKHLQVISQTNDVKTSTWMLEKNFPSEYAVKHKAGEIPQESTHVVQAIIKSIQVNTDKPVVYEHENVTDKKAVKGHDPASDDGGHQASTDGGGASIIP